MKHRIKLNGILILLATLAVILFPRAIIRNSSYAFDDFWKALGMCLILSGQLLRVSARGYKADQSRSGNSLVVSGPYAMVRNPMYLGIIMIGCGVVLAILNAWALLIFLAGFLLRYLSLFQKEEKGLEKAFGKAYKEYCLRVPRIFPKMSFIFQRDIFSYLPVRLTWVKRELISIIPLFVAVLLIELWEEINLYGWGSAVRGIGPQLTVVCLYCILTVSLAQKYEKLPEKNKNNK